MATTYGFICLSNGQTISYNQTTNGAKGVKLPVSMAGPTDANSNALDFRVKSPCKIVDWDSGAIASGGIEIYKHDQPTGVGVPNLVRCNTTNTVRVFPQNAWLDPRETYSLVVSATLPA